MSREIKVKMADILTRSGYSVRKSLKAVGYPFATSIEVAQILDVSPAPENVGLRITEGEDTLFAETVKVGYVNEIKGGALPGVSMVHHELRLVLQINYGKVKVPSRYISGYGERIPPTPTWPVPESLKLSK